MPYGDEKHQLIFAELVNILGERYVEDDKAIMEAYYRDSLTLSEAAQGRHEFIVLPGCVEDVQAIFKLANRYQFPVSISGSGMMQALCNAVPGYDYWCFIDPKRLNELSVDPKNMSATVGAYVSLGQVQAESLKFGLFHGVPGASTSAITVGHSMFQQICWTCWRTGNARNILGVEWVLPSGEIVRTGSLATGDEPFWGEGPGPDPRGILRGHLGNLGTFGVITKMTVKLFPIPGKFTQWPSDGVPQPEKKSKLPEEYFRTFPINFPTWKDSVDAIAAMGKAEIGGYVLKFGPWDYVCWYTKSMEEFWNEWFSDYWTDVKANWHSVVIGVWGFAGPKQTDYEEKVVMEIVKEFGGHIMPEPYLGKIRDCFQPNIIRDAHRHRFTRLGRPVLTGATMDSLYDTLRSAEKDIMIKNQCTPPLGEMGVQFKFWPGDFGHNAWTEVDAMAEKSHEFEELAMQSITPSQVKDAFKDGTFYCQLMAALNLVGPKYYNVDQLFGRIKIALDPNNIANPTRILNIKKWLEDQAAKEAGIKKDGEVGSMAF